MTRKGAQRVACITERAHRCGPDLTCSSVRPRLWGPVRGFLSSTPAALSLAASRAERGRAGGGRQGLSPQIYGLWRGESRPSFGPKVTVPPPQGVGRRASGPPDVPTSSGPPGVAGQSERIGITFWAFPVLSGGFGGKDMLGLQLGYEGQAAELRGEDERRACLGRGCHPGGRSCEPFCPVLASTLQRPWRPCEGSSLLNAGQAALGAGPGTQEQGHGETGTWELGGIDTGWGQGDTGRGTWHRDTGTGTWDRHTGTGTGAQ